MIKQLVRKVLYDILVHKKERGALGYEAKFTFKWVPDLQNTTTPLGEPVPTRSQTSGALYYSGVERTALMTLLFTGTFLVLASWASVQAVASLGWFTSSDWSWERAAAPIWSFVQGLKA